MKTKDRICTKCNITYKRGETQCLKCGRKLDLIKANPADRTLKGWTDLICHQLRVNLPKKSG